MKVFIVFLGLLLVNISFLTYQSDMERYVQAQIFLKALAEECAAGAALYYDPKEYSEGKFVFNYDEGRKYAEYLTEIAKAQMPLPQKSELTFQLSFQDDGLGYQDKDGSARSDHGIPAVTAEVTVHTQDLFRLPFLEIEQVTRKSKYELPEV